ncbi:MAG TPA: DUF5681 domain-containing protein [Stellaceae bacterium]|jgi:hypothetical protein
MSDSATPKPRGAARGRPFPAGRSGNPGGRRPGRRNRASLAAEALLDGEADLLTRRAVELAIEGDPTALKLCLERILAPRRERAVRFALPPIRSAADIAGAMGAVAAAVAEGALTPGEAAALAQIVDTFVRAIEASDFDRRLQALEADAARP